MQWCLQIILIIAESKTVGAIIHGNLSRSMLPRSYIVELANYVPNFHEISSDSLEDSWINQSDAYLIIFPQADLLIAIIFKSFWVNRNAVVWLFLHVNMAGLWNGHIYHHPGIKYGGTKTRNTKCLRKQNGTFRGISMVVRHLEAKFQRLAQYTTATPIFSA